MKKILTFGGAVFAFAFVVVTEQAEAQAVFESAYSQPAQMVDDLVVGDRISFATQVVTARELSGSERSGETGWWVTGSNALTFTVAPSIRP